MSFNENAGLDTSQVSSGGGRGKMAIGGGAGLVILVLGLVFGVDTSGLLGSSDPTEPSGGQHHRRPSAAPARTPTGTSSAGWSGP